MQDNLHLRDVVSCVTLHLTRQNKSIIIKQSVVIKINVKKLNSVKHCVRSQITRLKLQKSFCDLEHYEYTSYNSHRKVLVKSAGF